MFTMHARAGKQRSRWQALVLWPVGIIAGVAATALFAINLSPRPGVFLIRRLFEQNDIKVHAALEKHRPQGVASVIDEQYWHNDDDALLDVYFPEDCDHDGVVLPTVVWMHGGAWIYGSKDNEAPYFQRIAAEGYTVVAMNVSLSPDETYPTAVHQLNAALAWLQEHAARLHIDVNNIFLAGDSSGAQLVSQIAALTTNSRYAAQTGMTSALDSRQLKGLVLMCGLYDMDHFVGGGPALIRWGTATTMWAYTGTKDHRNNPALDEISTIKHVTAEYPAVFISGGNEDPLTDIQSRPLARVLEHHGVDTTTLFYPSDHSPGLGHEYHFDLDSADGQNALAEILAFIRTHVDEHGEE